MIKTITMKKTIFFAIALAALVVSGCQKGNLQNNPNSASASSTIPVSLILKRIDNELYNGGGVMDDAPGQVQEGPWSQVHRWNQFYVSLYNYYWGNNVYNWS